jgi:hypothetical protein
MAHGMFELDVSRPIALIEKYKKQIPAGVSFTAFLAYCLGHAVEQHKMLHAWLPGHRHEPAVAGRPGRGPVAAAGCPAHVRQRRVQVGQLLGQTTMSFTLRPRAQVERFFAGLDLVDPGPVAAAQWRPDSPADVPDHPELSIMYGGVERKR